MNKDLLESQWTQIRDILKEKFSNLSDDDIRQINGHYDQLVAKLQQKYGYSREEAEERIRSWNFDRFTSSSARAAPAKDTIVRQERVVRDDSTSSFFKWLLAIAIPLLLLAAYLLSPIGTRDTVNNRDTLNTPIITEERAVIVESPADRVITNDLRNAWLSQQNLAFDFQNVQITTHDGVVTLSGTVPDEITRDFLVKTAKDFSGVKQVVNNLQVK